jgi:hypothetical protein
MLGDIYFGGEFRSGKSGLAGHCWITISSWQMKRRNLFHTMVCPRGLLSSLPRLVLSDPAILTLA